jgi:hypothetical protein
VSTQGGFMLIEPVLLMGMLTSFNLTNTALGSLMIGLSLLALSMPKPAKDRV